MVARLKPGESLRQSFYYNEHKVSGDMAALLHAENYPSSQENLSEYTKLKMLEKMASLRPSVKVNSLHISLNFDPSEVIPQPKMIEIAREYMEGLGFADQPYLVYQHFDAAHPHLHILTTNITADGGFINLHHLAINRSEPTRIKLEKEFGLVQAQGKANAKYQLAAAGLQKIVYGKKESKKELSTVLEAICIGYRFTSLYELNAVLSQYNVVADRGNPGTNIHENGGLLYRILDSKGKPIGVPIKASAFHFSPTLKGLEKRFKQNEITRRPYGPRIKNLIDLYFLKSREPTKEKLIAMMEKAGIAVVLRKNADGQIYGITYVDHRTKCVFNGSSLGKTYSAKAIQERCPETVSTVTKTVDQPEKTAPKQGHQFHKPTRWGSEDPTSENLLKTLIQPEYTQDYLPAELSGKKKKKKKRKR